MPNPNPTAAPTAAPTKTNGVKVDAAHADATVATTPRTAWRSHVIGEAARNGVDADWIRENHAERMTVWMNAGETVRGAVEMLVVFWEGKRIADRNERETDSLRAFVRKAVAS